MAALDLQRKPLAGPVRLPAVLLLVLQAACGAGGPLSVGSGGEGAPGPQAPVEAKAECGPGVAPQQLSGSAAPAAARGYTVLPIRVLNGTTRLEVGYSWSNPGVSGGDPLTASTVDLGLWDQGGYRSPGAFRGWSGSRQGRLDLGRDPVFITAAAADRGYRPGPIEAGIWWIELGYGAISPEGVDWTVDIACFDGAGGAPPAADPVDPGHLAAAGPAWFAGDFHVHGYHSNPAAPDWPELVTQMRAGGLDFVMLTEYVTQRHHAELGAVQRANPDLLIWPGREIITYFGHAMVFGETPGVVDYRHGFEDVRLAAIQAETVAAGALFGVAHPTSFAGPLFRNFCRGCEFELGDEIDWSAVSTLEVHNGPARATADDVGLPLPGQSMNPFTLTALDYWDDLLAAGHFPTGVSGSDSKGVDDPAEFDRKGYGSSATMVYAEALSQAALAAALRSGHAYVRTLGVDESPRVEMRIGTADGQQGIYGDAVNATQATVTVTVEGGNGQLLRYLLDGEPVLNVPVGSDPFTHELVVQRSPLSGPLGTYVRIEVQNPEGIVTVIGNPVFLR